MENEILIALNEIKSILYIILFVVVIGVVANWIRAGISFKNLVSKEMREIFTEEADTLYDNGSYQKLIKICEEHLEKRKNNVNAFWYMAKAYYQLDDYEKSKKLFEKVIKAEPSWEGEHVKPYLDKIESKLNENR